MRRIALFGLLLSIGCTSAEARHIVTNNITISTTALSAGVFVGDTFHVIATPLDANGDVVPFDTIA